MEKRHQVFISSTFTDLVAERSEVVQALLELDCFPAGMEMFPAANEAAWELIKSVIDDSDYYCLILAGRYGTTDSSGMSYTEREYDYAVSVNKPLVAFLHQDPTTLQVARSEATSDGKARLATFRSKVETKHHCKYWASPEDLGGKVSRSIVALRKSNPSYGWVPGEFAADEASRIEVANLRARVAELEAELAKRAVDVAQGSTTALASGTDLYSVNLYCPIGEGKTEWHDVSATWDTILKYVGPTLVAECSEDDLMGRLNLCFFHELQVIVHPDQPRYGSLIIPHVSVDQIKVQLQALGQMTPGTKRRAVSDKKTYWKLTQSGEKRLLSIRAIPKSEASASAPAQLDFVPVATPSAA